MHEITLDDLLRDHQILSNRLAGIEAAIIGFGGTVPKRSAIQLYNGSDIHEVSHVVGIVAPYPTKGTWTDKIMYFLKNSNPKPMSAKELIEAIEWQENHFKTGNTGKVRKLVTQYTSDMAKKGRIGVNKISSPHVYSLIEKPSAGTDG
jgi:hypothetical protein